MTDRCSDGPLQRHLKISATPADTSSVTVDQNPTSPGTGAPRPGSGAADVERITATILTAVERQLTKYFTAMSHQAEAARSAAEQRSTELRSEVLGKFPVLEAAFEAQRVANEHYQRALQTALEERLSEFANHQHWRMNDLEERLRATPASAGVDPETILEIRQTVRDDMECALGALHARLEEITNTNRRQDEQASAIVQHVNDTTTALTMRMDQGDQRMGHALEERLNGFRSELAQTLEGIAEQVNDHTGTLLSKLESSETRATDRLLELESRIKEEQGQKIANLEATIGRIGGGFDDAMIAVSQRVLELENRLLEIDERISEMNERLAKVDQNALDEVKAETSKAIGEAMLVRIEFDRAVASMDEKLDKQVIRMSEIEGLLSDQMDVSTAVQLERLDELERQMGMLDPSQFVRVSPSAAPSAPAVDPGAIPTLASFETGSFGAPSTGSVRGVGTTATGSVPVTEGSRPAVPSMSLNPMSPNPMSLNPMSLNPRLPGADTTSQETLDTEGSFTPQ